MKNKHKIPVGVTAYHEPDGKIKPLCLHWPDGRKFEIDKFLDVRPAASLEAGGWGMRYICRILTGRLNCFTMTSIESGMLSFNFRLTRGKTTALSNVTVRWFCV